MPETEGEGETTTSTTTASGKNHHKSSKDDRPVDNTALAALLRESANFVERGEFDPILYQALQDFRVYYKQKYPKIKRVKSDGEKSHKKKSKRKPAAASTTKTETTERTAEDATETHDDENQEKKLANNDPSESTDVKEETTTAANDPGMDPGETIGAETNQAPALAIPVTEARPSPVEAAPFDEDGNNHAESTPISQEHPTVAVPVAATTVMPESTTNSTINDPGPVETAVPVHPAVPTAAATTTSAPQSPSGFRRMTGSPSTTTTKFHMGSAMFGHFKLPKLANNVKQAAFAATSKKNAQRAREDLGAFQNELAKHAEGSARRKVPEGNDSKGGEYYDGFCEKHFTMGCACQTRTFGDMEKEDGETTAGASMATEPAQRVQDPTASPPTATQTTVTNQGQGQQQSQYGGAPAEQHEQTLPSRKFSYDEPSVNSVEGGTSSANSSHKTFDTSSAVHGSSVPTSDAGSAATASIDPNMKPSFQRPSNRNSSLIANGWIEQYRRSKMRFVWKEVLASLVEGRKPGEETTLWIQREIFNPTTGRKELEALHQIPLKVLEQVALKEYTVDHQFALKIYNSTDEFVFRCSEAPADAMRWVQILKQYQQIASGKVRDIEDEKKGPDTSPSSQQQQVQVQYAQQQPSTGGVSPETKTMSIRELRAICHGAGINTAGMERTELENAAEAVRRRGTYFDPRGAATGANAPQPYAHAPAPSSGPSPAPPQPPPAAAAVPPPATAPASSDPQAATKTRLGIKELRAICHGAGINTVGMERGQLEAAAEEVRKRGTYFDPPPGMHAPSEEEIRARQEEYRKQEELRRQEEYRKQEEEFRRQEEFRKQEGLRARQEELRRRQEQEAIAEQKRREAEEARRRAVEEEARRRAAAEEEARRRAVEEEHRRRLAAEEQLRRQQEAQARYQQQQAAWLRQQQEEEQRRRAAEQQAAEQRRRHEEAMRKQQQWAGSTSQQHHQQQQQQWTHQRNHSHPQQQNNWQRQHYPQQHQNAAPPPPQNHYQQQQQQQHPHHHSAADEKYAAMANQTGDDGQAVITRIKHDILIQWALQPPQLQMLRPIDALITTIHKVFPPALGVSGHDYFTKWKPISAADIAGASGLPEEEKLKKSVRKIRFFLHPDKLPHDLNEEQKFMTKMLWDVTSDAWEEFQKHKADLDWVK